MGSNKVDPNRTTKICAKCKIEKPLDQFTLVKSKFTGAMLPHAYCRDCRKVIQHGVNVKNYRVRKCLDCGVDLTGTARHKYCADCYREHYNEYQRKYTKLHGRKSKCCDILQQHHEDLKDDPEHLTTDFIKKISKCNCKEENND